MSDSYIEKLCDFVKGCDPAKIPIEVREKATLLLLDSVGVAIANREKPFVRFQKNVLERTMQKGRCTVIGHPLVYVADAAAQLNSTAIHGSDFDATHLPSIMHTCSVVVPVALAVAEEIEASGEEVLTAVVAGFEVLIRMGLATQGAMHRVGFQSTALCAPIALALIAGRLYKMPREEIVSAAGLAASIAAGLRAFSDDGTWGKRLITGWACRAALTATALAHEGYPGTPDALEKQPFGFYKAFVQMGGYDLAELTRGLGEEWRTREIDLKRYPCSHGHHAFLDTARRARRDLSLVPESIESVLVHVSTEARKWWFEPRHKKYDLENIYGARFSMPYTIALVLTFGNLYDDQLDDPNTIRNPQLQALVTRVIPKVDDTLSNSNPNRLPGTIEIKTTDGRVSLFPGADHFSLDQDFKNAVLEKYWMNMKDVSQDLAEEIIGLTTNIQQHSSIAALTKRLRF